MRNVYLRPRNDKDQLIVRAKPDPDAAPPPRTERELFEAEWKKHGCEPWQMAALWRDKEKRKE